MRPHLRASSLASLLAAALLTFASCGDNETGAAPPQSADGAARNVAADGGIASDGAFSIVDGNATTTNDGAATDSALAADAPSSPCTTNNPYAKTCNGVCTIVVQNAQNCGDCGVVCTGGKVCSGTSCETSCLPGLTACAGTCVDLASDSAHCGACGVVCGAGQGCANGTCVTSIGATTSPRCKDGSGVATVLGGKPAGCVAAATFPWAACSCTYLNGSGSLKTDGFDSTKAAYAPGGLGGGVGASGYFGFTGNAEVGGALYNSQTVNGQSDESKPKLVVKQDVHAASLSGRSAIAGDVFATSITATDTTIAGTLHVPSAGAVPASGVTYGALSVQPVNVPPPCDCANPLPMATWLDAARPPNNDNASIGLSADALNPPPAGHVRVDLPCGRYFLNAIAGYQNGTQSVTIAAHGNVALFIAGDISVPVSFVNDPTGQLDVIAPAPSDYINALPVVGSPSYPALTRVYLGTQRLAFGSSWRIAASIYAPSSALGFSGDYQQYGSLFVASGGWSGTATIHYDRATTAPEMCSPLPPTQPATPQCSSCKDCGNQACVNGTCGGCTDGAQCCAPLVCSQGKCSLVIK